MRPVRRGESFSRGPHREPALARKSPPLNLEPRAAVYVSDYQGENQALTLANDKFADTLSMLQFSLIKLDSFLGEQLFVFVQK